MAEAVDLSRQRALPKFEQQGLIKAFEFTHELSWNVMKHYLTFMGEGILIGSRDATRGAFRVGLIANGEVWMDMIGSRDQTSHTYNQMTANEISKKIIDQYFLEFTTFATQMERLKSSASR